jgi:hypothetical protein
MKKLIAGLAGVCALALASSANAAADITVGDTFAIPAPVSGSLVGNEFQPGLAGAGLSQYTNTGASISLTGGSILTFEFLGSESGFDDTFTAVGSAMTGAFPLSGFSCAGSSCTEVSGFEDHFASSVAMGSGIYGAGTLAGLLGFTSNSGVAAEIGDVGFGIFLPRGYTMGDVYSTDVFYLGYDDFGGGPDDNHDDFVVRVTVTPAVPEPGTWAMMLLGFGAMGVAVRRSRKSKAIAQLA